MIIVSVVEDKFISGPTIFKQISRRNGHVRLRESKRSRRHCIRAVSLEKKLGRSTDILLAEYGHIISSTKSGPNALDHTIGTTGDGSLMLYILFRSMTADVFQCSHVPKRLGGKWMKSSSRQHFIKSAITRHHDVRTTMARRLQIELVICFTHIYGE